MEAEQIALQLLTRFLFVRVVRPNK
jgi:hypothetical protein